MNTHRILLITVLILVLSLGVSATISTEWELYQRTPQSTGYSAQVSSFDTTQASDDYRTFAFGDYGKQVLIKDFSTGTYSVMTSDTTIRLYNSDLAIVDEVVQSGGVSGQIGSTQYNEDFLISHNTTHVFVYEVNSTSDIVLNRTIAMTESVEGSGVACIPTVAGGNGCYLITVAGNVEEINIATGGESLYYAKNSSSDTTIKNPAIELISNHYILAFTLNSVDEVALFDITSGNLDTNFDTDGLKSTSCGTRTKIGDPLFSQLDGGGFPEIIVPCAGNTGATDHRIYLRIYSYTGTELLNENLLLSTGIAGGSIGYPTAVVCTSESFDFNKFCVANKATGVDRVGLFCVDSNGDTWLQYTTTSANTADEANHQSGLFCADVNNDDELEVMFLDRVLYGANLSTRILTNSDADAILSYGDIDGDGYYNIIASDLATTTIYYPSLSNEPPELTGTYGRSQCGNICLDTVVQFRAKDCNTGSEYCNYINDLDTDTERIVSYGYNGSQINGSYSLVNPILSITFDQVGSFPIDLYIQDSLNTDAFNNYDSITISVINGTAGLTCNLPCTVDQSNPLNDSAVSASTSPTATTGSGTSEDFTSSEEILFLSDAVTGQSPLIKAILVAIFTFGVIGFLVKRGIHHPAIYVGSITTLWVIMGLFGLINWIYIILLGIILALGVTVGKKISPGSQ